MMPFLRQQAATMLACDFLTVETVWLTRIYVLFFISLERRRIEYVACTSNPDGRWVAQQARSLLMTLGDRQQPFCFSAARSRQQVRRRLRRRLPERGHQDHPNADPGAERERLRRALGAHTSQRVPRPDPDLQPSTPRTRAPRLQPPLQPAQAAPLTRSPAARGEEDRISTHRRSTTPSPTTRRARRPHPRVRTRRMTAATRRVPEFLNPTGTKSSERACSVGDTAVKAV